MERREIVKKIIFMFSILLLIKPIMVHAGAWIGCGESYRYWDDNGELVRSQWKQIEGKWYFFGSNGYVEENTWIGNYYVGSDGAMLVNTVTPDGYKVGADGAWIAKEKAEIRPDNLVAFRELFWEELNEFFQAKYSSGNLFVMDYKNTDISAGEKAVIMNRAYELLYNTRGKDMPCKYIEDLSTDGELYIYLKSDIVEIMQGLFGVQTTEADLLALQAEAMKVEGDKYYLVYPSWGEAGRFNLDYPYSMEMQDDCIILKGNVITYEGANVASYIGTFKRNVGSCLYDYSFNCLKVTQ